jgi:micrococcal nuclease
MIKPKKLSKLKKTAAIVTAGLAVTAGAAGYLSHYNPPWELHSVYKVIDGDTIKIENNTSVRLIGINSPEQATCFYDESKSALTKLLSGKKVLLEKEISGQDKYGRLLRYVILPASSEKKNNLLVNDYLVRQGFAQTEPTPPDNRYRDLFNSAQEEAIRANRGLWANCEYEDQLSERREQNDPPPSPAYVVKGNISTRGYGKTYLVEGCDNYLNVKIDFSKGEQYFKTESSALKAGFKKATNCP